MGRGEIHYGESGREKVFVIVMVFEQFISMIRVIQLMLMDVAKQSFDINVEALYLKQHIF